MRNLMQMCRRDRSAVVELVLVNGDSAAARLTLAPSLGRDLMPRQVCREL